VTGPGRDELNRRLEAAGLPAARVHHPQSAKYNENSSTATEFFERHRSPAERQRLRDQLEQATPLGLLNEWAERSALARHRFAQLQPIKNAANEARRQPDRDRVREWSALHPERKRQHDKLYRERHPEQVKASNRRHYQRHQKKVANTHAAYRDEHQAAGQEDGRRWRSQHLEHRAELQREYRSDPDTYAKILQENRDRRRLINRLKTARLPPKTVRSITAAQRRKDLAAADGFFSRKRSTEERHRIKAEYEPTPPELLEQWSKSSALARRRLVELDRVKKYLEHHAARLREDVRLDSRARQAQGKPPLFVESEVIARARKAVSAPTRLTKPDKTRITTRDVVNEASKRPHQAAGESQDEKPARRPPQTRRSAGPDTGPHIARDAGPRRGPGLT
jgi:hypothetical protein